MNIKKRIDGDSLTVPVQLNQTFNEFPQCDIQKTIDDLQQYYKERNESCCFRIMGSINPIFGNELIEPSSINELNLFAENNNITDINSIIREDKGWHYYLTDECTRKELEPTKERFDMCNSESWEVSLYYPSECIDFEFNGVNLADGMNVYATDDIIFNNKNMIVLYCLFPHNLSTSSDVQVNDNIYNVHRIGNEFGDFRDNAFILDTENLSGVTSFKRIVNGFESEYYVRRFTKLDHTAYIDRLGFSNNMYGDSNVSFTFNENIDLCNLVDCFGKPIECVYIGIFKNNENELDSNGNKYWGRIQNGFDLLDNNIDFDITSLDYTYSLSHITDNTIGDVIEFNKYEVKEYTISNIQHRFNSIERFTSDYYEGYTYQPFHKVKIRNYSSYTETGTEADTFGIPDYATDLDGTRKKWRDLLDSEISDIDSIDYPFVNGCHYINSRIDFCLNRQDVCNEIDKGNENLIQGQCADLEPQEKEIIDVC